jgi:hypothetical protein
VIWDAVLLEDPAKRSLGRVQGGDETQTINILQISISLNGCVHNQESDLDATPITAKTMIDPGHFSNAIDASGLSSPARSQIRR